MTTLAETPYIIHTSGGGTTFIYDFLVNAASEMEAYVDGEVQAGFSVTGVGNPAGGTVVFNTAVTAGLRVVLRRVQPVTQETDLLTGGVLASDSLEGMVDKAVQLLQNVLETMTRIPQLAPYSGTALRNLVFPPGSNKVLAWNSDGTGLTLLDPTTSTTPVTDPSLIDDYSGSLSQFQTLVDPGELTTENLPTALKGEFERLRYRVAEISGMPHWYQTGSGIRARSMTFADFPAAGIAGRLARRADAMRGLWRDSGTYWVPETPWLNANEFGLHPSASAAANVTALQAAIDAADALGGGMVRVTLEGTYSFNNTVDLAPFVHLCGCSGGRRPESVIFQYTGAAGDFLRLNEVDGVSIGDLYLNGPGVQDETTGLLVAGQSPHLYNLRISQFRGSLSYGLRVVWQGGASEPAWGTFDNLWVDTCTTGVYVDGITNGGGATNGHHFRTLLVTGCTEDNILIDGCSAIAMDGVTSLSAAQGGTGFNFKVVKGNHLFFRNAWEEGVTVSGSTKGGVFFPDSAETTSWMIVYEGVMNSVPVNLTAGLSKRRAFFCSQPRAVHNQDPPIWTSMRVVNLQTAHIRGHDGLGAIASGGGTTPLTAQLLNTTGWFFITTTAGDKGALFYLGGGNNTTTLVHEFPANTFAGGTSATASRFCVFHDGSVYRMTNNLAVNFTPRWHMLAVDDT